MRLRCAGCCRSRPTPPGPLPLPPPRLFLGNLLGSSELGRGDGGDGDGGGDAGGASSSGSDEDEGEDEGRRRRNGGAAAVRRGGAAALDRELGLEGGEPRVVRDAARLAWLRRARLRLVVVLVPDPGATDGGGRSGDGGRKGAKAAARAGAGLEQAEAGLEVLSACERLGGSVLAGSWAQVLQLLEGLAGRAV